MFSRSLLATAAATITLGTPTWAQDTRTYTDALDRSIEIPVEPQRIVALHDWTLTTPLIELGAPVVGSMGRVRDDGSTYIRPANLILGVDFGNSDIAFVGAWDSMDAEAIATLEPDLIIGRARDADVAANFEAIAPVVLLDETKGMVQRYREVADVAGLSDTFEEGLARFETLLADARAWTDVEGQSYTSMIVSTGGDFRVYGDFGIKTEILDALGMEIAGDGARLREEGKMFENLSSELLPAQDADFVFGTYRIDRGASQGPQVQIADIEGALPGFCEFLTACAEGRMILLPREHAFTPSFRAWDILTHAIVSQLAGRPGIALPD
ncbi:MAG: ABC transporter substrate-binding protein [Shimia sp.]